MRGGGRGGGRRVIPALSLGGDENNCDGRELEVAGE